MAIAMKADQRSGLTKGELRQLRLQGKIPGVIYGKQIAGAANVAVDGKELQAILRAHPNAIIELSSPSGSKQSVMVSDIQRDSLSRQVTHVDFHQINMNENVRANVRIHAEGDSDGVREGGILQTILHELEVECLPGSIPESILADISSLAIGESLLVSNLPLPQGVVTHVDPEQVVVTILAPQLELTEEEAAEAEAEAEDAEARSREAELQEIKPLRP